MELNDNQIEIYDEEGNKYLMEILFTFEDQNNNSYAFIYDKSSPDEIIMMKYNEDGSIEEVTDDETLAMGEEVLDCYNNEPMMHNND